MERIHAYLAASRAHESKKTLAHRVNAGISECKAQHSRRRRVGLREDVGNAKSQHLRLAGAGSCDHHDRTVDRVDSLFLARVQVFVGFGE